MTRPSNTDAIYTHASISKRRRLINEYHKPRPLLVFHTKLSYTVLYCFVLSSQDSKIYPEAYYDSCMHYYHFRFAFSIPAIMPRLRYQRPRVFLNFIDREGNEMTGLFFVDDTPNTLRLRWLMKGLRISGPAALKRRQRCHISMIELLGSLGSVILDVKGQSLRDLLGIKHCATLILLWHWAEDCDGMPEAESRA